MRYLGGKAKIAKEIARVIHEETRATSYWDAFCGGLSMSAALAPYGTVAASDAFLPLIALYKAVQKGWVPPESLSEEEYRAARSLPDTDPLKAFAGFGCAFGGDWFHGYVRDRRPSDNAPRAAARSLARDVPLVSAFFCASFLDVLPQSARGVIYCDPPYANTTGYTTGAFAHDLFWARVQDWERAGVPVYVSEYACPVPHRVVWEKTRKRNLRGNDGNVHTDKLFRVIV